MVCDNQVALTKCVADVFLRYCELYSIEMFKNMKFVDTYVYTTGHGREV